MGKKLETILKYFFLSIATILFFSCNGKYDYQKYNNAKSLYIKGETEKALETLEELEKNPKFLLPYSLDGRISLFNGDYKRAENKLLHVLDKSSLDYDAVRWLAQVYLSTGQSEKALELAENALEKYPEEPRLLLVLASAQKNVGKSKEAITTLKRAFLFEEELAYSHFELATIYAKFALWDEYQKQLDKAAQLSTPESSFNKSINEILKRRKSE